MDNRDNRDKGEAMQPVRFRAVIEMTFLDADPWDPSDYDKLIEEWRKSVEDSPLFKCKEVVIKEILTIGESDDDYESWRHQDLSHVRPGVHITERKGSRKR
jgi:hypothetical protein